MLLKEIRRNEWEQLFDQLIEIEEKNKGQIFPYPAINWITEKVKSIRAEIEFSVKGMTLTPSKEINDMLIREQDFLIEDFKESMSKMKEELLECSTLYIERHAALNAVRITHEKMLQYRYRRRVPHEEAMKEELYRRIYEEYTKANAFIVHKNEESTQYQTLS